MECLFCKIVNGTVPSTILIDDKEVLAFRDLYPKAPTHVVIIPKQHISSIEETDTKDELLLGHMLLTAKKIAAQDGINSKGYRLVFNVNPEGGQEIYHIHLHLLGGSSNDLATWLKYYFFTSD